MTLAIWMLIGMMWFGQAQKPPEPKPEVTKVCAPKDADVHTEAMAKDGKCPRGMQGNKGKDGKVVWCVKSSSRDVQVECTEVQLPPKQESK